MGELAVTLLGGGSVLGLLTLAFGFFLKGARDDRRELNEERAKLEAAEKSRDEERALRRAAEDREAKLAREVTRLSEEVALLRNEVERLRAEVGRAL